MIPGTMINRGTNEQRLAELVLSGPGGRMLGRDVQWVLGANYRRESGSVAPDSLHANYVGDQFRPAPDLFRLTPEVSGTYAAYEVLTAVQVPLLHDRPSARDMVLNAGLRWSNYGSFDSRTTWQAGLRWQLADELALRANYADVFRAPSLVELYERPTYAEQFIWDPCGNDPVPDQVPNCAANGVPDGAYVQGSGTGVATMHWTAWESSWSTAATRSSGRRPGARSEPAWSTPRCGPRGFPQASTTSRRPIRTANACLPLRC